jgi:RNA polymerase sigma-B factor
MTMSADDLNAVPPQDLPSYDDRLLPGLTRDPAAGDNMAACALPCVSGEMKRHFGDRRWQIRVGRPAQELVPRIRNSTGELARELGHEQPEDELAAIGES